MLSKMQTRIVCSLIIPSKRHFTKNVGLTAAQVPSKRNSRRKKFNLEKSQKDAMSGIASNRNSRKLAAFRSESRTARSAKSCIGSSGSIINASVRLLFSRKQIDYPATAHMWSWSPAMIEYLVVVATGVHQGIGKDWKASKARSWQMAVAMSMTVIVSQAGAIVAGRNGSLSTSRKMSEAATNSDILAFTLSRLPFSV